MKKINLIFAGLIACVFFFTGCKKVEVVEETKPSHYMLSFNANGGVGKMAPQLFEPKKPQALTPNIFFLENYLFSGWNTASNGNGTAFDNEQLVTATSNITLYAQWKLITKTHFASFFANGGVGTMEPQPFFGDELKPLTANTFERKDHHFNGWNTRADGSGTKYQDRQLFQAISRNIALYAQWKPTENHGVPCPGTPTVRDIDGNTYNTVQIGSQCWMKENLKTTKFITGIDIPHITDFNQWLNSTTSAMCYYKNVPAMGAKYGALYNGYAVLSDNLCPPGWHVPSLSEWNILVDELGGGTVAGYKMKTVYDWMDNPYSGNGNGSNESGFSCLPAGFRGIYNDSAGLGYCSSFWSSSEGYCTMLSNESGGLSSYNHTLDNGYSVRCVKN
jgi:uncharacterized protein (TIGR02145 family)/uncharacterized repeat protein (TIGR02543 family)